MKRSKNEIAFFMTFWTIMTMLYFTAQTVWAQAVEVSAALPQAVSQPPVLDQAQHFVDQLSSGWAITIAIFLLELAMRTFKTKDPKSLLYVISNVLKMIVKVCEFLAQAMDKVLQRMKDQDGPK